MTARYVFDTGALVAAERGEMLIPLPVVAEWWRGRTDARERRMTATMTIDAIVMATAALHDAAVVTSDVDDLTRLKTHFPGVVILSV